MSTAACAPPCNGAELGTVYLWKGCAAALYGNAMNESQSTGYAERLKTRVRIFTSSGSLEGDYAHPPGVRVSDSLRNAATSERYMLLTDVTMRTGNTDPDVVTSTAPFILLNTQHANVIVPLDEE